MIGILILFFIARWVYNLAKDFKKPYPWLYAILAVVVYYASVFIVGILIGILVIATNSSFLDSPGNELLLSLIAIPFGFGGVALLRYLLKRSWSKQKANEESEILDETISEL